MRYPWVNTALLALTIFQVLSGFLGLVTGSQNLQWILRLHDIGGYAILVLLAWKGIIILDVFGRLRRLGLSNIAFIILTILLVLILATGIVWPFLGYSALGGFSLMTIHALLVIALVALFAWHALARRFVFRSPKALDRRAFLRASAITLAGLASWQVTEVAQAIFGLPGTDRRFTGSFETGSHTGVFPFVSWLTDSPSPIARDRWQLIVDGAVEHPLALRYDQLTDLATDSVTETIDCTGGWFSTQTWSGVGLARVLDLASVQASAQSVTIESVTGYSRRFGLDDARHCLLALRVAEQVLDHGHGFPIRLVAPGQRGFNWVKWITHIRVNETSALWQTPVPLQ
jgi:DMSO/TMAO reductase YedYZ molybdopterin-dependent catalytic subunit